jgi:hypothetical protein
MRRIRKNCNLATAYKAWHDALEEAGTDHPKYSSQGQYYRDVLMNLCACQDGLCAYSEIPLCAPEMWGTERWENGRYNSKPEIKGNVEHFDSGLKEKQGWLWTNLFLVDSDINTKVKGAGKADPILKPDAEDYDEFQRLHYNAKMHIFIANPSLPEGERERINRMIRRLGINYSPIQYQRRIFLKRVVREIEFDVASWDDPVEKFPTAFEMLRREAVGHSHIESELPDEGARPTAG